MNDGPRKRVASTTEETAFDFLFLVVVASKNNPLTQTFTVVANEDLINCVNATVWVDAVLDTYWKEYVM